MFCGFDLKLYQRNLEEFEHRIMALEEKNKLINNFDDAVIQLNTMLSDMSSRVEELENKLLTEGENPKFKRPAGRPRKHVPQNYVIQKEAATSLGMSSSNLSYYRECGEIKAQRVGREWHYSLEEIERFKKTREYKSKDLSAQSWLTQAEAVQYLNIGMTGFRRFLRRSKLRSKKIGNVRFFSKDDLDSDQVREYIEQSEERRSLNSLEGRRRVIEALRNKILG